MYPRLVYSAPTPRLLARTSPALRRLVFALLWLALLGLWSATFCDALDCATRSMTPLLSSRAW